MGSLLEMAKSDAHPLPRQMELLGLVSDGIALTVATATAKMSGSGGGGDVKEPLTADQKVKYTGLTQNSGVDPAV